MSTQVKSEDEAQYGTAKPAASADDNTILKALMILETRIKTKGAPLLNPQDTRNYLRIELAGLKDERFCALFLDTRHRVIEFRTIFHGTIDGASVYPRVVARIALEVNAKAVIFAHNHPSGDSEPSEADRRITDKLKDALNLFEIRVIDHVIVGDGELTSFADRGLL